VVSDTRGGGGGRRSVGDMEDEEALVPTHARWHGGGRWLDGDVDQGRQPPVPRWRGGGGGQGPEEEEGLIGDEEAAVINARGGGGRRSVSGMEDKEALVPAHARRRGGGEERWKWARVWKRKRPSVVLYIQTKEKGDARYM